VTEASVVASTNMGAIESKQTRFDKATGRHLPILSITKFSGQKTLKIHSTERHLETADAVARAAHLWLRGLGLNKIQDEVERQALAGGLVAGLCDQLILNAEAREIVSYIYTLLNDEGPGALAISRRMLEPPTTGDYRDSYDKGIAEATHIVELLAEQ